MTTVPLSLLAIVLGALAVGGAIAALMAPGRVIAALRAFPRSMPWGVGLMLGSGAIFLLFLRNETLADFERLKPVLMLVFGGAAVGMCFYVRDLLAVRGLALAMMILAKVMVDAARWHESQWRWVITTLAYVYVVMGMWLTVSPWRLRDWFAMATASESRLRALMIAKLVGGLALILLGLTIYRV